MRGLPLFREPINSTFGWTFQRGDRVRKKRGAKWRGIVVGFYSSTFTPEGYAIESTREVGSVQLYPVEALVAVPNKKGKAK